MRYMGFWLKVADSFGILVLPTATSHICLVYFWYFMYRLPSSQLSTTVTGIVSKVVLLVELFEYQV